MSPARLRTSLTWFDGYDQITSRVHFKPAFGPMAMVGYVHNRLTGDLFGEFICRSKPLRGAGERVSAATLLAAT